MTKKPTVVQRVRDYAGSRALAILDNLGTGNLWKRILKNVVCITIIVSIALIPGTVKSLGRAAYLGVLAATFGHPGRRFGQMAEALSLTLIGGLLGVAWGTLGVFLSSLVMSRNAAAAYTIRGVLLAIAAIFHGFVRSRTPRIYFLVLIFIIYSVVLLTTVQKKVTKAAVTSLIYPLLMAAAVVILVNLLLFPEFSSEFLGRTTIETLDETKQTFLDAGNYFVGSKAKTKQPQKTTSETTSDDDRSEASKTRVPNKEEGPMMWYQVSAAMRSLFRPSSLPTPDEEATKDTKEPRIIRLSGLIGARSVIRSKLAGCKAAQQECNFELAFSILPPHDLKPISVECMKNLTANVNAIIATCETKFALIGEDDLHTSMMPKEAKSDNQHDAAVEKQTDKAEPPSSTDNKSSGGDQEPPHDEVETELDMIKPRREIEFGDARLLQYLHGRIAEPYRELSLVASRTIDIVNTCVAYAYGVPKLPSGTRTPKGVQPEELEIYMDQFQRAQARFAVDCMSALEGAANLQEMQGIQPDIMPREEIFLIASFILNVQQAAAHVETMLQHAQNLVAKRNVHGRRRRLYAPKIKLASWLATGGEDNDAMPAAARNKNRKGTSSDIEDDSRSLISKTSAFEAQKRRKYNVMNGEAITETTTKNETTTPTAKQAPRKQDSVRHTSRSMAADTVEWLQRSDDLLYALKLTFAAMLTLFPAFVPRWNEWYYQQRGLWAALQLIIICEVSLGSGVYVSVLRLIGTTLGCLWGWAAYECRQGQRVVSAAMLCIGLIPCCYVQLGSQYPKAGIVAIISMCIVTLSTELQTVPGTATENFLKRFLAFLIGGVVSLIVQLVLFPVRSRTRLVDSLVSALEHVADMERCIAFGIEQGRKLDIFDPDTFQHFEDATAKANNALQSAEALLPFCTTEPRIKGSFHSFGLIYTEIIFVLHQIIDRMENMLQLRTAYGSGPLEELNADIFPYRRNVAGSVTLILFAIRGALMTKIPLPQFLPSARLAYLRLINRVREVVLDQSRSEEASEEMTAKIARQRATRRKYMAWNASSAAQIEVIEFLEELIDLVKLLVGANEFTSGLLSRENYAAFLLQHEQEQDHLINDAADMGPASPQHPVEGVSTSTEGFPSTVPRRRTRTTTRGTYLGTDAARDDLSPRSASPPSLHPILSSIKSNEPRPGRGRSGTAAGVTPALRDDGVQTHHDEEEDQVPVSLKRIQTRKIEAGMRRQRTRGESVGGTGVQFRG